MDDKLYLEFYISNLITKKIGGQLTSEEERFLTDWAAERKENADLLNRLLTTTRQDYLIKEEIRQSINKNKGWQRIQTEISGRSKNRKIVKYMQAAAAVFTVFLLSQYLFSTYKNAHPSSLDTDIEYKQTVLVTGDGDIYPLDDTTDTFVDPAFLENNISHLISIKKQKNSSITPSSAAATIIVPRGTSYKFSLMDGTKVWLNANSKLVFPTRFDKNKRQISLVGEAFFEVAPNPLIPFTIDVNGTEVCVVGTAFNIIAYGDTHEMVTTVVEGQVLVSDAFWKKKVPLLANEQLRVNNLTGIVQKKTIDAGIYTAWIRGRLVFENENLENLMSRLERLYDVKITISGNVDKSLKFTGDIKRYDDLNKVLDMLATTQNVHFSIDEQGITVCK
jgi:ferric-dicitrate binding protein FerR (iron transport regulator)